MPKNTNRITIKFSVLSYVNRADISVEYYLEGFESEILLFLAIMALPATAQITILAMDDVKKSEPIDELVFCAQYELKMVEDTTKADRQPNSETMMLEVGKKCSQFYSYTTYLRCTYDGGIFPPMEDFLHHLKAKAYQNRKIAFVENGSWAPTAARQMKAIVEGFKNIECVEPVVTIKSTLNEASEKQMDELVAALTK